MAKKMIDSKFKTFQQTWKKMCDAIDDLFIVINGKVSEDIRKILYELLDDLNSKNSGSVTANEDWKQKSKDLNIAIEKLYTKESQTRVSQMKVKEVEEKANNFLALFNDYNKEKLKQAEHCDKEKLKHCDKEKLKQAEHCNKKKLKQIEHRNKEKLKQIKEQMYETVCGLLVILNGEASKNLRALYERRIKSTKAEYEALNDAICDSYRHLYDGIDGNLISEIREKVMLVEMLSLEQEHLRDEIWQMVARSYSPMFKSQVRRILKGKSQEEDDVIQDALYNLRNSIQKIQTNVISYARAIVVNETNGWLRRKNRYRERLRNLEEKYLLDTSNDSKCEISSASNLKKSEKNIEISKVKEKQNHSISDSFDFKNELISFLRNMKEVHLLKDLDLEKIGKLSKMETKILYINIVFEGSSEEKAAIAKTTPGNYRKTLSCARKKIQKRRTNEIV